MQEGHAVYRARTLLSTYGGYDFADDDLDDCDTQALQTSSSDAGGRVIDDTFKLENSGGVPTSEWSLSPNPTRSGVWLSGGDIAALQSIRLFDLAGRTRKSWDTTSVMNGELRFNTVQLPSGIYYVQLVDSTGEMSILKLSVIK